MRLRTSSMRSLTVSPPSRLDTYRIVSLGAGERKVSRRLTRIDTSCITRDVSETTTVRRPVPKKVYALRLGERIRWARKSAGLSHDKLVDAIGRSNRGHLIKVEHGEHTPRADLRDAIADATNVPRELFADEDEDESRAMPLSADEFAMLGTLMARLGPTLAHVEVEA